MIELAPNHKRGLSLRGQVLPATGVMGFGDAYRRLIPVEALGAFVTNPVTGRARQGASPPRVVTIPGGILMHTGLSNRGVTAVIRRYRKRWARCPVPVIVHVVGVNVEEATFCVEQLSRVEAVAGIEIGLPDSLPVRDAIEIITAVRSASTLPLIVKLPLWQARDIVTHVLDLGGVDAITVAAPPRGTVWHQGRPITGRLYGPTTFPQSLWVLHQIAALTGGAVPLIGCGGIHSARDARAMLDAGAAAVQVDSFVWKDPSGFIGLAATLMDTRSESAATPGTKKTGLPNGSPGSAMIDPSISQ